MSLYISVRCRLAVRIVGCDVWIAHGRQQCARMCVRMSTRMRVVMVSITAMDFDLTFHAR